MCWLCQRTPIKALTRWRHSSRARRALAGAILEVEDAGGFDFSPAELRAAWDQIDGFTHDSRIWRVEEAACGWHRTAASLRDMAMLLDAGKDEGFEALAALIRECD